MDEKLIKLEYRNWLHGQPPKRIKLNIGEGSWAGENTWKTPQPWHCKPYSDAATYNLEIIYTWQTTCIVTCDEKGRCEFEGDFSQEKPDYIKKDEKWEPFASFAPWHFGYVSMVDIKTPPDHSLLLQPHPRVYADRDGSIPIAIPGMLEMDWWPEIFFMVFKAPLPNHKLIFKHGDPIASCLVVPKNIKYDIQPMSAEEEKLRAQRQFNLEEHWNRLCTRVYYSEDENEFFDNKYKILSNVVRREGIDKAAEYMDDYKKVPHYYENPQLIDERAEDKRVPQHAPWSEEQLKQFSKKDEVFNSLGEVDKIIANTQDFNSMNDSEFERLIAAFKRQKRISRRERSIKLKSQSDPKKAILVDNKPVDPSKIKRIVGKKKKVKDGEWVLGHKIEKIR